MVLRHLSGLLAAQTRPSDMLVRLGGEEFVLVLDGMGLAAAVGVAERLLRVVSAATVISHGVEIRYTVSIGAADSDEYGYNLMQLISKGDAAMYQAKRAGRNRVATLAVDAPPSADGMQSADQPYAGIVASSLSSVTG